MADTESQTVLMLAGEASGDAHGAEVARALADRRPDLRLIGLGGEKMRTAGVEILQSLDDLAVMGFLEVVPRIPFFFRLERRLTRILDEGSVSLVLPIDYPGFNLRMTRRAHRRGIPVLYYIAPQVWAWKARRAERLAREADRIAVILPFEEAIFRERGGNATFVGHPLVERPGEISPREEFCTAVGVDPERPILALLPGSRVQELDRHLGPFVDAARILARRHPDVQPVIAAASSIPHGRLSGEGLPVTSRTRALLHHARAAIVKSGTSTLETALEGTPFVVAYRTNPLTFALARHLVQVEHIALANLVAGRRVVPEVLQSDVTGSVLADRVEPLLDLDSESRRHVLEGLSTVRARLGEAGAAGRVAEMALALLKPDEERNGRDPVHPGPGSGG